MSVACEFDGVAVMESSLMAFSYHHSRYLAGEVADGQ